MEIKNTNSKKIRIMRSSSFLTRAQGPAAKEYYDSGSQSIGSYYESTNSKRVSSGLSMAEEQALIPTLLGLHPEDRDYFKERNLYFATFETQIPPKDGLELEIGLEDSTQPMGKNNLPLNVMDYLRYRHAAKHPWVSTDKAQAEGNQLKHFYIYDSVTESSNKTKVNTQKDKAMEYYLKIKDTPNKVNMMLMLLGEDYRDIEGQTPEHTVQLRGDKLRSFIDTMSDELVKLYEDRDFDIKYTIEAMVRTGVLKRIGAKVVIAETGDLIGNYEATVLYFKDEEANSATISLLKEKMQEGLAKARKVKSKKIVG